MKKMSRQALWVLAGVILIRGFASGGINMTASLFLAPVAQELGTGIGSLSIYFSIMSVVTVLWLPIAGKLLSRFPVRPVAFAAAALQALTFACFGLLDKPVGWYLLSIPQAMGTTIVVSLLSPILIHRWFPHNTGLILGVQMAFVWVFAAGLQQLASGLIASEGWRSAYISMGLLTFSVVAAAIFIFLRDKPDEASQTSPLAGKARAEAEGEDIQIPEAVATRSASFIFLLIFMITMTGAAVFTQHIPAYGGVMGYTLRQVGMAMSFASIGSAIGSVAIGLICDRIGGLKTCCIIIFLWLLAVGGFLAGGSGFAIFILSAFLHGVASSAIAVLAPMLTLIFYGKMDYEKIYAKVSMGAPLASILLVPAYGFVYDATGSYFYVLVLLLAMLGASFASIMLGWRRRCTAAGCPAWRRPKEE